MITRGGLIELESGWHLGIVAVGKGQIRMFIEFDPRREGPTGHGVKELRLTVDEAREVAHSIGEACWRATGTERR